MRLLNPLNSAARTVRIWNSLAKPKAGKVDLTPKKGNLITWYACGPTVYDSAHIGHASSYIRLDIIRRILERQKYKVIQILGITDIDDKIINRSNQLQVPWESLSRKYEIEFVEELEQLNVKPAHVRARVTNYIPQIIAFVEKLVNAGFAYPVSDGSVYFDTSVYTNYGKFASGNEDFDGKEGKVKRNPKDFAVWKGWKPNEPFWITPWGKGRPGWHIECSVMATHYFGPTLDIHSGGSDLMFPHHENEEAQCCARFGLDRWVTHWIHTGHLITKETKMSKSLGNTLSISEFLQDNPADSLRMLCLMLNSVRSELLYSSSSLDLAKAVLGKFENFISDCNSILYKAKPVSLEGSQELWELLAATETEIENVLCDDFSTSDAIDLLIKFVSEFHRRSQTGNEAALANESIDFKLVLASQSLVQDFLTSLGFTLGSRKQQDVKDSALVQPLLEELLEFRQSVRAFSLAFDEEDKARRKALIQERQQLMDACDQVRLRLGTFGIHLKDHGKSSSWVLKSGR